jgi:hypothetical protein
MREINGYTHTHTHAGWWHRPIDSLKEGNIAKHESKIEMSSVQLVHNNALNITDITFQIS